MRVCILISGRGSNMEALVKGADCYTIQAVISNRPDAAGIDIARGLGAPCVVEPSLDGIGTILDQERPDLVCMAGFMRILPKDIIAQHTVMNIHPSLLPKYPGLHAVRQALDDGATHTGCTVHFADAGIDTGSIISQAAVEVADTDTEESLAARILKHEHIQYVEAVRWYARVVAAGRTRDDMTHNTRMHHSWHTDRQGKDMKRMADPHRAASYAAGCHSVVFISADKDTFIIDGRRPKAPPYVAAVPGDTIDTILERIRRLA